MRRAIKIVCSVLIILTTFCLSSCEKDRDYDEAEVVSATRELLEKSRPINELFYGSGFDTVSEGQGIYRAVTEESTARYGIYSVEELKEKTLEVFSDKTANTMFAMALSSVSDGDDGIVYYSRYYQAYDDSGAPTCIMANTAFEGFMTGDVSYYPETVAVVDVEGEVIVLEVLADVESKAGKTKTMKLKIKIVEESDGWRLSSPSYAVYNESTDIYEDLKK